MEDLFKRLITGIILAAIAIGAVIYLPNGVFKFGIAILSTIAIWEVVNLLDKKYPGLEPIKTSIVGFFASISALFLSPFLALLIIFLYGFYLGHKQYNISYLTASVFSLIYGAFFVSSIGLLHQINKDLLFVLFATIWSEDIIAYLVGKTLGKNKLAPRLSPKKTWEGAIGGFLGAVIIGGITAYMLKIYDAYIPIFAAAILGQIGDLFESFIKRQVGEKDSSNLIPGHGGVLDRIDALVFASVVFVTYYHVKFVISLTF
ncbi:MAG: phosphatidate cytidylyltransferase [Aquificae bacterium]|nr:phosphatidate cytidylyltransferase [Aquificota bacterium]